MRGVLYINDEYVGMADLSLSFGHERAIELNITRANNVREYVLYDGDVYVRGPALGVRGFFSEASDEPTPVLTTFELIPAKKIPLALLSNTLIRVTRAWHRYIEGIPWRASDATRRIKSSDLMGQE